MTIKPVRSIERELAIKHFRAFLEAMGYVIEGDPAVDSNASGKDTPTRAVDAYIEFLTYQQERFEATMFPSQSDGMIAATHLEFFSLCCHHMLPYRGVAHIGYIPDGKVAGLSKLVRILDHYAHRLSIQEQITEKVATFIVDQLSAKGCGVVIEAEHLCLSMRGVRRPNHVTVTSDMRGCFREASVKQEFMALIDRGRK